MSTWKGQINHLCPWKSKSCSGEMLKWKDIFDKMGCVGDVLVPGFWLGFGLGFWV